MKNRLLTVLVYIIYQSLRWTWRLEVIEPPELKQAMKDRKSFILSHWHGDELVLLQLIPSYRIATIVSTSKDGEMMNTLVGWMQGKTSRGSSTRGAVSALKGLIRLVREGYNCSFAVDGPKGPIYQVKPGVFEISRALDLPIYWSGVACDRAFHFPKSWNKTYLPKPFARIYVRWFGPMSPITKDQDPRSPELAQTLERALHAAKQQAFASIAEP